MEKSIHGYTKEDLMKMDPVLLRTILHERTHHTIEVMIYRILNGKLKKPQNFGSQVKLLLDVWKKRKLRMDTPDLQWCIRYLELADKINADEKIDLATELPKAFTGMEMKAVIKLLYERRSIRQFKDEPVPEKMIREILQAGLMAPQGCNVGSTRFIILRSKDEWKLVSSDIPIENGIIILICQDMRVYKVLRFDEYVPQNVFFDAAAAADHMVLMAHALGLGACWLTHREETQKKIRRHFGLPETFVSRCHLIIGWPDEAPIKSQRMNLEDTIINKRSEI